MEKRFVCDDMLLTVGSPTTAGSRMLQGYQSLFEAEALTRLKAAGYTLSGKTKVGEFGIDLLGETCYTGPDYREDVLLCPACEAVKEGAGAALVLDVNGAPRRGAAQAGLVAVKPTYGTVSRFGTVPVACSGETVSVIAKDVASAMTMLSAMAGHDDKDGTSLPDGEKKAVSKKNKVALLLAEGVDAEVQAKLDAAASALGVQVCPVEDSVIRHARAAWNILMSAELCNNVSRYDGVKYGYRTPNYQNLEELYTNSRTEAFGDLLKSVILFGSETLSTDNYQKVYDKAMRVRRLIAEAFAALFAEYDAVLMPACSAMAYKKDAVEGDKELPLKENFYTAPASITGLPAVVAGGVQLVGPAFSEALLAEYAERIGG